MGDLLKPFIFSWRCNPESVLVELLCLSTTINSNNICLIFEIN